METDKYISEGKLYEKIKFLNSGAFASVYKVKNAKNNHYAMKIFKSSKHDGIPIDVLREITILKTIKCPHVISLIDVDNIDFNYIILPLYRITLNNYIKTASQNHQNNNLLQYQIKNIFHKICLGIYSLHSNGIIHRDIKTSNICLSSSNFTEDIQVVLIDCGLSKKIDYDRHSGNKTPTICSLYYQPPEIVCKYKEYSFEVDIWSAGCVLAEMYLKVPLFPAKSEIELLDRQAKLVGVNKNNLQFHCTLIGYTECNIKKYFANDVSELLINMLKFNPLERHTIADCLNSSYFDNGFYNISSQSEISDLRIYKESSVLYEDQLKAWKSTLYFKENINDRISFKFRRVLICWLYDLCIFYNIQASTYFTCIMILDFFSIVHTDIEKHNYQLLGLSSLLIATKLDTKNLLTIEKLLKFCRDDYDDGFYTVAELLEAEKFIFKTIDINFPNLYNYFSASNEAISKGYLTPLNEKEKERLYKYLIVIILYPDYYRHRFSVIVRCCTYLCSLEKREELDEEYLFCLKDIQKWFNDYLGNSIKYSIKI